MELQDITTPLLNWYGAHARVLPWRENVSPYRVWISEIMLQQTRVDTVIPYYERFLAECPAVGDLAALPEARLLKLWEGLGYYSRARNLRKAAKTVMEKFGGEFPADYGDILSLPGIGEYTAGAISSIAFNRPVPAVDGNVLRVVSRLTGSRCDIAAPETKAAVREALRRIYPAERCGDFTQSLMELGATVCLPNGRPACAACPLAALCRARLDNTIMEIPVKSQKKARGIEMKTVLLLRCEDKIAVRRRAAKGLLAGLWEFPVLDGRPAKKEIAARLGIEARRIRKSVSAKHIFSHLEWHMAGWLVDCAGMPPEYTWVTAEELKTDIALPAAFKAFRKLI